MEVSINGVPPHGWFLMGNPTEMDDLEHHFRKPQNIGGFVMVDPPVVEAEVPAAGGSEP